MSYITITTDVDVDIDDVLREMSRSEKRDLYEVLDEEFGPESPVSFAATSYYEEELSKALNQIWDDRHYLTQDQRDRIIAITKESFIEK